MPVIQSKQVAEKVPSALSSSKLVIAAYIIRYASLLASRLLASGTF